MTIVPPRPHAAARAAALGAAGAVAVAALATLLGMAARWSAEPAPRGTVVFEGASSSGELIVRDRPSGVRELLFERGGAVQTAILPDRPEVLVLPYTRLVMAALAVAPEPERVLLIGLGGGAMVRFLGVAVPLATVDAVEVDPAVVAVARRFFGISEDPRLHLHVGDGRGFVERSAGRWDLVILDAYGAEGIPTPLTTREFLAAVRARTAVDGVVVANLWSGSGNPLYGSMLATFLDVFDQVLVVAGAGSSNRIVLALPAALADPAAALLARAETIDTPAVVALDLPGMLRSGLETDPRPPAGAQVLTDAPAPDR